MGNCRYCGEKAGFMRDAHGNCVKGAEQATHELVLQVKAAIASHEPVNLISDRVERVKAVARLPTEILSPQLLAAADAATLSRALEEPVDTDSFERIGAIYDLFSPGISTDPQRLLTWPGYLALINSNTLYQVMHGIPLYCPPEMSEGFVLRRDETPIQRRGAVLMQHKAIQRGSSYQSVGVPLGRGVYYRLGSSMPRAQEWGLTPVDSGTLLITNKATYFGGQRETMRIPHSSILRLESFNDAVGIHPSHGRAMIFVLGTVGPKEDGWYFYNLLSHLAAEEAN